jgi:diguanylate cyclase (GGDEF)-like protein
MVIADLVYPGEIGEADTDKPLPTFAEVSQKLDDLFNSQVPVISEAKSPSLLRLRIQPQPHNSQIAGSGFEAVFLQDQILGSLSILLAPGASPIKEPLENMIALAASHAALVIEAAQQKSSLQQQRQQTDRLREMARIAAERREILHHVSQEIVTASLDKEGIYSAIHLAAARLMPAEAFVITHFDETKNQLEAVYLIDRSGRVPVQVIPLGRGVSGRVFASRQSVYIPETTDPELLRDALHFGDPYAVRSLLAVPMFLRGHVVGTLSAQSYQPNAYTDEDQTLLEMLSSYAAIALENARLFRHIQKLAITDPLTNLFNRRHLFDLGRREFQRARRFNRALAVILIDLDHFHDVNESYGHKTGDYVLNKIGQLIKAHIREIDIAGRYGGEEFALVLPETSITGAIETAERLRTFIVDSFQQETFYSQRGSPAVISASFGVARMTSDSNSFTDLLDRADQALFEAKSSGRNRVIVDMLSQD